MIEIDDVQASIREHLLGRVKGEEREPFEERFISDPEFREVVLLIESELFDDYAANLLSDVDRDSFVSQYVNSPSRNKDVQFTTELRDQAVEVEKPVVVRRAHQPSKDSLSVILTRKSWIPILASGAVAIVCLVILGSAISNWIWPGRKPDFSTQVALLNQQPRGNEPLFPIVLQPIQNRGPGEGQKISIPSETGIVELQCRLPEDSHRTYAATLRVVNGAEVFSVDQLHLQNTPNGKRVDLRIPAHILTPQDYIFSVKGLTADGKLEDVADYFFRIVK
jgi:hypothetical protein